MPETPRRLPPSPEERLSVVVSRMAGGSNAGATRWARPISSGGGYRAATAEAPPEAPAPAASGPLLSVLVDGVTVTRDIDVDGDQYRDVLVVNVQPGRLYLVEATVLASNSYQQLGPSLGGNVDINFTGPNLEAGTSQAYRLEPSPQAAVSVYPTFTVETQEPYETGVTFKAFRFLAGVSYGADPDSPLKMRAQASDPFLANLIHPSTFMRATDIGPVVSAS